MTAHSEKRMKRTMKGKRKNAIIYLSAGKSKTSPGRVYPFEFLRQATHETKVPNKNMEVRINPEHTTFKFKIVCHVKRNKQTPQTYRAQLETLSFDHHECRCSCQ